MGDFMFLAESGQVREAFLEFGPQEVAELTEPSQLHFLAELVGPANHHNCTVQEEEYLHVIHLCIKLRLADLAL